MGTQEIKDAFNAVSPDVPCTQVLVWLERDEAGKEWQLIRFRGTTPDNKAFEATTDRHSPNDDPVLIAREVARNFVEGLAKDAK